MQEVVAKVKDDAGALFYEWLIGDDDRTMQIYERYADADAALRHIKLFDRFAERFLAAEPISFT